MSEAVTVVTDTGYFRIAVIAGVVPKKNEEFSVIHIVWKKLL